MYIGTLKVSRDFILLRYNVITMSDSNVYWIVQLSKEMKEYFDTLAAQEGDTSYGAGARRVKRVIYDFMKNHREQQLKDAYVEPKVRRKNE
jgi:uncharacterized protein YegL